MNPTTADTKIMSAHMAHIILLWVFALSTLTFVIVLYRTVNDNSRRIDVVTLHAQIAQERATAIKRVTKQNCKKLEDFKGGLLTFVKRSDKTLRTNSYFATHPIDLARARQQNADLRQILKPADC